MFLRDSLPYGKDDKYYTKMLKMSEKRRVFENKGEHLFTLHKSVLNNHRIFSSKTPVLD